MNLRVALHSLLDVLFPPKEGSIGVSSLSLQVFLPLLSVTRDIRNDSVSILPYRNTLVRESVHALKYKRQKYIGSLFGQLLHDALLEDVADWISFGNGEALLIIPIPLSEKRRKERGYNQAEQIARAFVGETRELILVTDLLGRTKDTGSQTTQEGREARIQNLKGAFTVLNKEKIAGKTIVLIDDVITTGATMDEAKQTLLKAGARKVYAVAVAH
jgi:ComF family protein